MPKLETKDKTVLQLFQPNKTRFLVPDYQRPYEWGKNECKTLWEDLFKFSFPDNDHDKFDPDNDEYFLGPIVIFTNDKGQQEIIDGQQRLTTLILLLRAFYSEYEKKQDKYSVKAREEIGTCIWKTAEIDDTPYFDFVKLDTEVAIDETINDFYEILKTGQIARDKKSRYAENYRFFQEEIKKFCETFDGYLVHFSTRILKNCMLLEIKANSSESALQIFSTLNDRGKPLSDADIFKAQFYKHYSQSGRKDDFIEKWKELEKLCSKIYHPIVGTPMDEAFTRYMYYERAKQGNKNSTVEALRKFYEKGSYNLLKKDETFENIIDLANFWDAVSEQDKDRFSERVLKRLFVLNYAPNGMWTYITSVYYLVNRDKDGMLDDEKFYDFLNKITAFIWGYSFINPGVNALRIPIFAEMVEIIKGENVDFDEYKFDIQMLKSSIDNYVFSNIRPLTKSMLAWWAFNNNAQNFIELDTSFQIEHIYAKNCYEKENSLTNPKNLESLGNKILLESNINIAASDYRFADKVKYYKGKIFSKKKGKYIGPTDINELQVMSDTLKDFTEDDIVQRNALIIQKFIDYLKQNDLTK